MTICSAQGSTSSSDSFLDSSVLRSFVWLRRFLNFIGRDSSDIDGDDDIEMKDEQDNSNNKENNYEKGKDEREENLIKQNEEYFHLKYELRYFV